MKPRIGVLTSGGDCPGLNAVLRGVVLAAEKLGWEVVGFRDGFEELLPPGNHVIVDRQSVNGIMALGGTIIGITNRGHFVAKVGAGDRTIVPENITAGAKKILDELQVRALIIVGGDGSMVTAQQLQEAGINCIGVPKTIDNDLEATATTFGFDSAVRCRNGRARSGAYNGDQSQVSHGGRSNGPPRRLDRVARRHRWRSGHYFDSGNSIRFRQDRQRGQGARGGWLSGNSCCGRRRRATKTRRTGKARRGRR